MSDTTVTIDPPLPNSPEARTPTGELKDQAQSTTSTPMEEKPLEEPKAGETLPPKKEESPTGAPEAYANFTLPEGVKLEPESFKSATDLFKAQGLSQTQAQALVDFHVAQLKSASDASTTAMNDMRADWQAKTKA